MDDIETTVSVTNSPVKKSFRTKDIVDEIKKAGFNVKITHRRYFGDRLLKNSEIGILIRALKIMGNPMPADKNGGLIRNHGGNTTVEVYRCDEKYHGEAECSMCDVFNYGKAARLAIWRALHFIPTIDNVKKVLEANCLKYVVQLKDVRWIDGDKFPHDAFDAANEKARQLRETFNKETRVSVTIE